MRYALVALMLLGLLIAHQDYWQWNTNRLVLGFLPYSLAYQIGISLAASAGWWLVTLFCWPKEDSTPPTASASEPLSTSDARDLS